MSSAARAVRTLIRSAVASGLLSALMAMPSGAQEPEVAASQATQAAAAPALDGLQAALAAQGCRTREVLELEGRWYAACGVQGVLVLAAHAGQGFELVDRRLTPGEALAIFARNGLVWVEVQRTDAQPLSHLPQQLGSTAAPAQAAAPPQGWAPPAPVPSGTASEADRAIAPRRVGDILALSADIKPFLPIDELAFAGIGRLSLTYHGERAWYLQAQLMPLGGFAGKGRDRGVFGGYASAGYDHWLFAVGLGVGVLKRGDVSYSFTPGTGEVEELDESMAFSISQSARLGAVDGLSLSLTNAFVLDDERWRFGFVDVGLQVPVGRRTWITASGGGGEQAGFFYAELGLRRLVRGDRERGSLFVTPSVGVAGIDTREQDWSPGPMIGVHLEWRP